MSGFIFNRLSSIFSLAALVGALVISTHSYAEYRSSSHIKRSHSSAVSSRGTGGARGYIKQNKNFNAQYRSSGIVQRNNGLRLNTFGNASRSGVKLGKSRYSNQGYGNKGYNRQVRAYRQGYNDSRRIQHVKRRRDVKNEGYSYGTNPRYNRNVQRTNQYNSDSDVYYIDQFGVNVISSNNPNNTGYYNNNDGYYDDGNQVVIIDAPEGDGSPTCPQGHECGYRLYEDGTGPRIISLGSSTEGLPPQDGLNGGPKIITLGK